MTRLFDAGDLSNFLAGLIREVTSRLESVSEDELLARSTDDLLEELLPMGVIENLSIGTDPVDGSVEETTVDVSDNWQWHGNRARGFKFIAVYEFAGDARLFRYRPSQRLLHQFDARVSAGRITVEAIRAGVDITPQQATAALKPEIDRIRKNAEYASHDVDAHNRRLPEFLRPRIEQRKDRVRKRRDLAGALGFPLQRRTDAPKPVPLKRKAIGSARTSSPTRPYADEPALTEDQYEDAISVVRSTLLAMERTPSVASGKGEEELRDQILVQLNGTFTGNATGETFVQRGKTDILVRVDDRHVFVGECKWWTGSKACSSAIDQLLSYLPWRDEKAALILFIDRKDATAIIDKADETIRDHVAFKRSGKAVSDSTSRRNFVLGHPDDPKREIHLAMLPTVLPKEA